MLMVTVCLRESSPFLCDMLRMNMFFGVFMTVAKLYYSGTVLLKSPMRNPH